MSPTPVLPADWTTVVERLHDALSAALDAAAAQEERLTESPPAPDAGTDEATARLHQRLNAMQACCERAARAQAEAEAALVDAADRIVGWLAEVGAARRTLADGPDGAVS